MQLVSWTHISLKIIYHRQSCNITMCLSTYSFMSYLYHFCLSQFNIWAEAALNFAFSVYLLSEPQTKTSRLFY